MSAEASTPVSPTVAHPIPAPAERRQRREPGDTARFSELQRSRLRRYKQQARQRETYLNLSTSCTMSTNLLEAWAGRSGPPEIREGSVGPGKALQQAIASNGTVVATIVARDNYVIE